MIIKRKTSLILLAFVGILSILSVIYLLVENTEELPVRAFTAEFIQAIKSNDAQKIRELVDENGFYSITYFVDNRDPNVVLHIEKDEIRDDLALVSNNKLGLYLRGMFAGIDLPYNEKKIPLYSTKMTREIAFPFDWEDKNESFVAEHFQEIIDTSIKINMVNNQYVPQLFVLKDNYYAFVRCSGVFEPYEEFTGDWVIFKKQNGKFVLRAIMFFE